MNFPWQQQGKSGAPPRAPPGKSSTRALPRTPPAPGLRPWTPKKVPSPPPRTRLSAQTLGGRAPAFLTPLNPPAFRPRLVHPELVQAPGRADLMKPKAGPPGLAAAARTAADRLSREASCRRRSRNHGVKGRTAFNAGSQTKRPKHMWDYLEKQRAGLLLYRGK